MEGPSASVRDSRGNEKIGLAASTQISRKKFGIIWNEAMESGGVGSPIRPLSASILS